MFWLLLFVVATVALAYASAGIASTTAVSGLAILLFGVFGHSPLLCMVLALAWAALLLPLNADALRQEWFTRELLERFRHRFRRNPWGAQGLPGKLGAGWEAELMQPRMDWERLQALPAVTLGVEEQDFLDGPVETLCRLCHAWRSGNDGDDLPEEIWTFLRRYGLLALRVPREQGGLGFSATAVSAILAKIGSSPAGIGVAEIISQANAHGLVDWLIKEGTELQQLRWLPAVARGEAVVTLAPADLWQAAAGGPRVSATGIVIDESREATPTPAIRLDLRLPAVALAPVADLIGICFELQDPDRRLGREPRVGTRCVLLPRDTPGLEVLRDPGPFGPMPRGTVVASGLVVPLDWLLGGAANAVDVERLAGCSLGLGRSLPLASAAAGNAAFIALATAAMARMLRQDAHAWSDHGIVRERLARMGAAAYGADALRRAGAAAVDRGESSAAAPILLATQCGWLSDTVTRDALDLLGPWLALQRQPAEWLAYRWRESAIPRMAEGANARAGHPRAFLEALRHGHPFLDAELRAARDDNAAQALEEFDALIWPHLGRVGAAAARSWLLGITGSLGASAPSGTARRHRQRASRYAAALTLTGEAALLSLGDELADHDVLLDRLGEILGLLLRLAALLRKWEEDQRPADDWALVDWACLDLIHRIEAALAEAHRRLPGAGLRALVRLLCFPYGRWARPPRPALTAIVAARLWSPGSSRQRLTAPCFAPRVAGGPLNALDAALSAWLAAEPLARRCEEAQRQGRLAAGSLLQRLPEAVAAGLLDAGESEQLRHACEAAVAIGA